MLEQEAHMVARFHCVEQSDNQYAQLPVRRFQLGRKTEIQVSKSPSTPYYLSSSLLCLLLISEGPKFFKENEKVMPCGTFICHWALWVLS